MKNTPISVMIIIGALAMAGILFTQIYWVSKAIDNQEEQFNHSVQMALRSVVESLCKINGNDVPSNDPIDQISSNYFIARTNNRIDLHSLDYLIRGEFQKRNIQQDFEYGVYDCQTNRMVYGDLVTMDGNNTVSPEGKLPNLYKDEYYFGVYFPSKTTGIVNNMGFWKFTTILTVLIICFFGYALFLILRQRRLSEIQKDFVNNITHEFQTPIATLKVASEVLSYANSEERRKKYASIIQEEVARIGQHVDQLLRTAVIDHSKGYKMQSINPMPIIQEVLNHFVADQTIVLKSEIPETVSNVLGESTLLEHVLYNLLENAKKYSKGNVEVLLNETRKTVVITIKNDGIAIPKSEQKRIFKKFYRVSNGDVHNVKGFGLGLYFVKKAVRLMKGEIQVISHGNETTFEFQMRKS